MGDPLHYLFQKVTRFFFREDERECQRLMIDYALSGHPSLQPLQVKPWWFRRTIRAKKPPYILPHQSSRSPFTSN